MSKLFTAKDIKLMGEPHPQFGQTFWGSVHEQNEPVRFNLREAVDIYPGRLFSAEEWATKTSSSGNDYTQLKKVTLVEKGQEGASEPTSSSSSASPASSSSPAKATFSSASSGDSYEPGTNARWAIKLSIDTFKSVLGRVPEDDVDHRMLHDFATWLLDEFQRLKVYNSGTQVTGGDHLPGSEASKSEQSAAGPGYDKFKASRPLPTAEANEFLKSLDEDEEIN